MAALIVSLDLGCRRTAFAIETFVTHLLALMAWGFLQQVCEGIGLENVGVLVIQGAGGFFCRRIAIRWHAPGRGTLGQISRAGLQNSSNSSALYAPAVLPSGFDRVVCDSGGGAVVASTAPLNADQPESCDRQKHHPGQGGAHPGHRTVTRHEDGVWSNLLHRCSAIPACAWPIAVPFGRRFARPFELLGFFAVECLGSFARLLLDGALLGEPVLFLLKLLGSVVTTFTFSIRHLPSPSCRAARERRPVA
jgi:hypothetical protein